MHNPLYAIDVKDINSLDHVTKEQAITSLESGKVIYFPAYSFELKENEHNLLSEGVLDTKHKNISYDYSLQRLAGLAESVSAFGIEPIAMLQFMHRFAVFAKQLLAETLPHYNDALRWGRTSFRPAEIKGRTTSKRKDDTRVHVDSFSSTPVNGLRILRVFCNINPNSEPRVWHIGEPFHHLLPKFSPSIPPYSRVRAKLLQWVKATKSLRSPYDHYMLHLHDNMKLDEQYQKRLTKHRVDFPPNSTWIVFTDHVSHAALSGQFLLEQTFYLPVPAMENPALSPLRQWEIEKACVLV